MTASSPRSLDLVVDDVFDGLHPFEQQLLERRYGRGQDVQRIAHELSSTPTRVSSTLMGIYRRVAAAVESATPAERVVVQDPVV